MKKILTVFLCISFLFASTVFADEVNVSGFPDKELTGDEAKALLEGKEVVVTNSSGLRIKFSFLENGTVFGNGRSSNVSGKWFIQGNDFCMKWNSAWPDYCLLVRIEGGKVFIGKFKQN